MTDCILLPCWASEPSFLHPGRRLPTGEDMVEAQSGWLSKALRGGRIISSGIPRPLPEGLSDPFLLIHGPGLRAFDPGLLEAELARRGGDLLVVSHPSSSQGDRLSTKPDGRVCGFGGMSDSNLCDAGVWLLRKSAAEAATPSAWASPGVFLRAMLEAGAGIYSECLCSYCRTVSAPTDFLLLCGEILDGRASPPCRAGSRIVIDPCATVAPDSHISGLAWIAAGAVVGTACRIENCAVLEDASVGEGATVRNALVLPGARIPPGADLSDKYLKTIGG
ncbi:MAG TPA: hypothetical protein PLX54_06465 [Candidatus Fermentibacter daniensis]|nr:hypothetical protein [Candidatus Fermentibacter sp.]NLI01894.1 hypothetical protein [Candidatus Fermentibacter daniensis]OQC70288.1 MAG: hypothetical protein BWX47_00505 [candidate division Hyd24-12 bacterium ADurb.Bin004]MCC6871437.1 hypothetical protein [Candidatus Fermentibacter sp.]HOA05423.1 hypothetical protein [Candidatus Fermentibacter daniensis]